MKTPEELSLKVISPITEIVSNYIENNPEPDNHYYFVIDDGWVEYSDIPRVIRGLYASIVLIPSYGKCYKYRKSVFVNYFSTICEYFGKFGWGIERGWDVRKSYGADVPDAEFHQDGLMFVVFPKE